MKTGETKSRKRSQGAEEKQRPPCGTLSYIAACRGLRQKAALEAKAPVTDDLHHTIRRRPVEP